MGYELEAKLCELVHKTKERAKSAFKRELLASIPVGLGFLYLAQEKAATAQSPIDLIAAAFLGLVGVLAIVGNVWAYIHIRGE